jgi:CDP-glucose 4,6-dehydratase
VIGTINVLESCKNTPSVRGILVVTSDKCYLNQDWPWGYRETDTLGGHDPYSASKAAVELVISSYRKSFFNEDDSPLLASARVGNVIGGGDWSEDRLLPDMVRSLKSNSSLEIRSPNATRPWQHVLESLSGYLLLGQKLLSNDRSYGEAWNFGPNPESNLTVYQILQKISMRWKELNWQITTKLHPHEANALLLDSTKALNLLRWKTVWNIDLSLDKTVEWYDAWLSKNLVISRQQLSEYTKSAFLMNLEWARM